MSWCPDQYAATQPHCPLVSPPSAPRAFTFLRSEILSRPAVPIRVHFELAHRLRFRVGIVSMPLPGASPVHIEPRSQPAPPIGSSYSPPRKPAVQAYRLDFAHRPAPPSSAVSAIDAVQ
ncbi:hypothetical protein MSAN_02003900 [Mycena sanguinolenta]|uniref:Uncharacterized protein n=1 Tax=Mycena sanguinolenta TaxID=230812 RepID=A0A8H6XM97_9AGAR|nr:hypothetical protein MSAN_02003900 [Mycena sanguinolenta]